MKRIIAYLSILSAVGCSEAPQPIAINANRLKEAVLRTRQIYSVDKNMDKYNPLTLKFYQQYPNQLVEINFNASQMNNSFSTVLSSDYSAKGLKKRSVVSLGTLAVELDGTDITQCLIDECNATSCLGTSTPISSFSGDLSTAALYLSLSKLSMSSNPSCSSVDLNSPETFHSLTFKETSTPLKGARLKVQVIVYNRTFKPEDMLHVFNP